MRNLVAAVTATAATALAPACIVGPEPEPDEPTGLAVLGGGTHDPDQVKWSTVVDEEDGLNEPRDLAFNPAVPGELWIVNRGDDSVVIVAADGTAERKKDPFALHFMEEVSSLSFADDMTFATCQESRNTYDDQQGANDFMGPALWSADPEIFAQSNPEAVAAIDYDLGSHIDMLHESPLCMGIAWAGEGNVYFTFDGLTGTISRYDFREDHGPGFDDHSDGVIERFAGVDVVRVEDVPSHMVVDPETGLVYVADTGNARIAVFDPESATDERSLFPVEAGTTLMEKQGASIETLVDADTGELEQPSGLTLHDGLLYVTDHATSRISAFTLDGERVDYLETGVSENRLMGLRLDADGNVLVVDNGRDRVLKIQPKGM
jgi:DNA-binding beta-propeller fold protein YncE